MPDPVEIDYAAGGLVRRASDSGVQIAIIRRKRHDDWTLPKGHLKEGESWQDAAIREVREETGCEVQVREIAEPISYLANGTPKLVLFYHMDLVKTGPVPDKSEVQDLKWVAPRDALRQLSYRAERLLIEHSFVEGRRAARGRRSFWPDKTQVIRRERLEAELATFQGELNARIIRYGPGTWAAPASNLLQQAYLAFDLNQDEKSWRTFHTARRLTIFGMKEKEERRAEGHALLAEGEEKLKGWRKDTVVKSLRPAADSSTTVPAHAQLYHARAILDEHLENVYQKLALFKGRLSLLPWMLIAAILGLFLIVVFKLPDTDKSITLGNWERLLVILSLGVLGATFSSTLTTLHKGGRIPQVIHQGLETLVRPLVGAVGAAIVVIILESGIISVINTSGALLYPAAIAAGFSERLVTNMLERIEASANQ